MRLIYVSVLFLFLNFLGGCKSNPNDDISLKNIEDKNCIMDYSYIIDDVNVILNKLRSCNLGNAEEIHNNQFLELLKIVNSKNYWDKYVDFHNNLKINLHDDDWIVEMYKTTESKKLKSILIEKITDVNKINLSINDIISNKYSLSSFANYYAERYPGYDEYNAVYSMTNFFGEPLDNNKVLSTMKNYYSKMEITDDDSIKLINNTDFLHFLKIAYIIKSKDNYIPPIHTRL